MPDNPLGMWGVAAADQINAAVADDDWEMVAKLGVDGYLKAVGLQHSDGSPLTFVEAVATFGVIRQDLLAILLADAMTRLYNDRPGK